MNAIVALCHFCEQHGPSPVFCTQVIRGSLKDCLTDPPPSDVKNCASCLSIGADLVFLSTHDQIQFVSTQSPILSTNIIAQIKHSAFRSLSCDIYPKRESGFVFFGDSTRGHVLSHAFEIQDESARGQRKLYSIIVLMKDKMFLLNIEPFLSEYLLKISKELQDQAAIVFKKEHCGNARTNGVSPPLIMRSLAEMTGEKNVFANLHSHFCWLLWGGSRYLSEQVTIGSPIAPPWLGHDTEEGFTMIQVDKEEWLFRKQFGIEGPSRNNGNVIKIFRMMFNMYRTGFIQAAFCCLTGITMVVRGDPLRGPLLARGFSRLLPDNFAHRIDLNSSKFDAEKRIVFLPSDSAVPQSSSKLCIIECLINGIITTRWSGELPNKLPDMLQKIVKFCDERMLNDDTLEQQLKVLVHEWKNKVICLKQIQNSQDLNKMKKVLGVQPQDAQLVSYWIANL